MKTMKELEKMTEAELSALVAAERTAQQEQRFGLSGGDIKSARAAKKTIARALTILTNRLRANSK